MFRVVETNTTGGPTLNMENWSLCIF